MGKTNLARVVVDGVFFSPSSTTTKPRQDAFICIKVRVLPRTFAIERIDFFSVNSCQSSFSSSTVQGLPFTSPKPPKQH